MDQPVCPRCLKPVDPHKHYCECGNATGALTLYLPWESIPAEVDFLGRAWKRLWNGPGIAARIGGLTVVFLVPFVLIGLPWALRRRRRASSAKSG